MSSKPPSPRAVTPGDQSTHSERSRRRGSLSLAGVGCDSVGSIRIRFSRPGLEQLEARFRGYRFAPHRHDTYAIGLTLSGVQTFRYRGEQRYCRPNQCHILHPDELHDGEAATESGFSYRMLYVDPSLVQMALPGRQLPFVADPIVELSSSMRKRFEFIWDLDSPCDDLELADISVAIADLLLGATNTKDTSRKPLPISSLVRVREKLLSDALKRQSLADLECIAGLDRWTLARHFRAAFGTSPTRFRTMRQLDHVRSLARRGVSLAEAAIEAGFADQSHMSRMFKRAYGLTPAQWIAATMLSEPRPPTPTDNLPLS